MRKTLTLMAATGAAALCLACDTQSNTNTANSTSTTNTTVTRNTTTSNIANTSGGANTNTAAALSSDDRTFITTAAQGGLMEVELGRLAEQKAQNPDVKRFGQRMVEDHTRANTELKNLASSKGITVPSDMNSEGKDAQARLSKLSGAAFDKEYMSLMVEDHQKDVSEFEETSKDADDPDVKAFAAKTLPTLQQHLQMAQPINARLK